MDDADRVRSYECTYCSRPGSHKGGVCEKCVERRAKAAAEAGS